MARTKRTIVGKGYLNIREQAVSTAVAVTPGALMERVGGAATVRVHSTEGGIVEKLFALEDAFQGKGINDDYGAAGVPVMLWSPVPGERVYALTDQTSAVSIAIGDFLVSHGDGTLTPLTVTSAAVTEFPNSIVGVALEAGVAGTDFRVLANSLTFKKIK
ncbi:hypothetical protein LCGC14_1508320 [marine sediment metagenome]|uniref:Uncharacterized protein n=1 Tax=marine sediment metagenome TaxID=412755 RepID=A0A0F9M3B2_9ZZZZ